jgi:hypothetical protein
MAGLINPVWTKLRIAVVAGGLIETAIWLGVAIYTEFNHNPLGDGMEFVAVYFSTLIFLFLTLPGLVLGSIGRWLPLGALLIGGVAVLYAYVLATSL